MHKLFALLFMLLCASTLTAQLPHTTQTEILPNEKWWGIFVGGNAEEPFDTPFSLTTQQYSDGSFRTSMMISSNGRYVWSANPIDVTFNGKIIALSSMTEKPIIQKGGRNLREAYLVCCLKNICPDQHPMPSRELFTKPVYDLRLDAGGAVTQEMVLDYASRILSSGFPAGNILLPESWQSMNRMLEFDNDLYPNPKNMVVALHQMGFNVMLTVTPYVPAAGLNYLKAKDSGTLITDSSGKPVVFETLSGYNSCLDLARGEIASVFEHALEHLRKEYGADGFRLECHHVMPFIASDVEKFTTYSKNWSALGRHMDMIIYSPSYFGCSTSFVNALAATETLSWENLSLAVSDILNAGLSGYPYSNFGLGAAAPSCSEELKLRALQMAIMMPVAIVPPVLDNLSRAEYNLAIREAITLRMEMGEYMEKLLAETASTSAPMVRHMEYQYPKAGFANCSDQFLLGNKYLVAPISDPSGKRTVRLPRGVWTDASGVRYRGPRVISLDVSSGKAPWFTLQRK